MHCVDCAGSHQALHTENSLASPHGIIHIVHVKLHDKHTFNFRGHVAPTELNIVPKNILLNLVKHVHRKPKVVHAHENRVWPEEITGGPRNPTCCHLELLDPDVEYGLVVEDHGGSGLVYEHFSHFLRFDRCGQLHVFEVVCHDKVDDFDYGCNPVLASDGELYEVDGWCCV